MPYNSFTIYLPNLLLILLSYNAVIKHVTFP